MQCSSGKWSLLIFVSAFRFIYFGFNKFCFSKISFSNFVFLHFLFQQILKKKAHWDWYTRQITSVKHPRHNLAYLLGMAYNWHHERSLNEMIFNSLYCGQNLAWIGIVFGDRTEKCMKLCNRLMMLFWHLLSLRSWSFARHSVPPESYVCCLNHATYSS